MIMYIKRQKLIRTKRMIFFVNSNSFSNFANDLYVYMHKIRFIIHIIILALFAVLPISAKRFTLVIDAGHGGHDAGAVGAFSKEKDINLRTALAFGRYVERYCPDVSVIYTRKTDVFVTLHGRAEIANKAKADLFISIHTNALPGNNRSARGLETYTLGMHRAGDNLDVAKRENSVILVEKDYKQRYQGFDPNSSESYIIFEFMQDHNMQRSVDLAKFVQRNVCSSASRPDKGVKQAGFLVLRETSMPSCLIELGFISTPSEEQMLNSESGVDNIARGIYQAFVAYRGRYDSNFSGSTSLPAPVATASADEGDATKAEVKEEKPHETRKSEVRKPEAKKQEPQKPEVRKHDPQKPEPRQEAASVVAGMPIFKVQVLASDHKLKTSDSRLKGHADADFYNESGMYKYTVGSSANYNEIYQLRKQLVADFPDCFIIAFKDGVKMNVNEAIREFKNKR